MPRDVLHAYRDPLGEVWLGVAARLGWRVERSANAYASWDGNGTLSLALEPELDADDTLAQMILHEICHALVAGPAGQKRLDWGLDNTSERDVVQEHATNRLQAALTDPYGLRVFLAVTTDFRSYYDALPRHPLDDGEDPAIPLARSAKHRAEREPFCAVLHDALEATARLALAVRPFAVPSSLWHTVIPRHPSGLLRPSDAARASAKCGDCAWAYDDAGRLRCRQTARAETDGVAVEEREPACERFEPVFDETDCASCGACCREGFDLVPLGPQSRLPLLHPELVSPSALGPALLRPGGRCVALDGVGTALAPYRCRIYDDRPESCSDFEVRGSACLLARQRVGLSARP